MTALAQLQQLHHLKLLWTHIPNPRASNLALYAGLTASSHLTKLEIISDKVPLWALGAAQYVFSAGSRLEHLKALHLVKGVGGWADVAGGSFCTACTCASRDIVGMLARICVTTGRHIYPLLCEWAVHVCDSRHNKPSWCTCGFAGCTLVDDDNCSHVICHTAHSASFHVTFVGSAPEFQTNRVFHDAGNPWYWLQNISTISHAAVIPCLPLQICTLVSRTTTTLDGPWMPRDYRASSTHALPSQPSPLAVCYSQGMPSPYWACQPAV